MSNLALRIPVKEYDPSDDAAISAVTVKEFTCQDPDGLGNFSPILSRFSFQPIFANYTAVTVKAQATLDGSTYFDLPGKTTSTSGGIVEVNTLGNAGPYLSVRILATATLSGSTDTMEIWVGTEYLD